MMKKIFLIVMVIALVLLIACKPMEKPVVEKSVDKVVEKSVVSTDDVTPESSSDTSSEKSSVSSAVTDEKSSDVSVESTVTGDCTPSWKCIGGFNKAYLMANCSWNENTKCKYGCVDGECKKPPVCVSGFKCRTDNIFGYQNEGCFWSKEETCELGCKDNACVKPLVKAVSGDTVKIDPYAVQNKTSDCDVGWKCADNEYTVYQDSYCTLNGKSYCAKGCVEGKCAK